MAVSPAAQALRSRPGYAPPAQPVASFQPATFTPVPIPEAPTLPVQNAANLPRESFLRDLLDPSKPTYLGNRFKPDLQRAGRDLRQGLEGFGNYGFTEDAQGLLTPKKEEGGQPGRHYKDAYFDARSQAGAAGMLYSRSAEEAIGTAWHRLGEQERAMFNQYGDMTSEILSRQAQEFTGVTSELTSLYGEDVRYALENPIIPPAAPEPSAPPVGAGVAAQRWVGKNRPDLNVLSKAWGIPISQIRITQSGPKTGSKYVATVKG